MSAYDAQSRGHFAKTATLFGIIATFSSASIAISSQYQTGDARENESPSPLRERSDCLVCGGWLLNVSSVKKPANVSKVLITFDAGGAVTETDRGSSAQIYRN